MEKKRLSHRIVILTAVLFLFGLVGVVVLSSTMGCHKRRQEQKRLPTIHITTRGEIPWQGRTSCTIACVTWNDSTVWSGKIKFRGGVSSKYGKHSYALKLSEAHALCGLPEEIGRASCRERV